MKTRIGRTLVHLLLVLFIMVLIPGCNDASGAPTIPPVETFVIPFDILTGNTTSSYALSGDMSNWSYAAGTVVFWGVVVEITLAVPVAAFRASFLHTPVQQPDGSWIWSYSVMVGGSVYSAELHGQFITEGVHWDMSISKEGEYEDFLWYYGEHNLPATEGLWILKKSQADPTEFIKIDWSRNISPVAYTIRYTNIEPGGQYYGYYIDVQYTEGATYDYSCDIYKGAGNHTYIDYSSSTGEGRVKDFDHFVDNDWHCWGSYRMNVTCP